MGENAEEGNRPWQVIVYGEGAPAQPTVIVLLATCETGNVFEV